MRDEQHSSRSFGVRRHRGGVSLKVRDMPLCDVRNSCLCRASPAGLALGNRATVGKRTHALTKKTHSKVYYLEGFTCCPQWNDSNSLGSNCADREFVSFCTSQQCCLHLCKAVSGKCFHKSCMCQHCPAVLVCSLTPCHLVEVFIQPGSR